MTEQDDVAASRHASGARCARCGHVTRGCPRCGRNDPLLGSSIGDDEYCHTFSEGYPTCYMLTQWEASDTRPRVDDDWPETARLRKLLRELRSPAEGKERSDP